MNPYRTRSTPTEAAAEIAFSNDGVWICPIAASRVSTNSTADERRVDSSWRIMSSPIRATLGQWIRRRSSPTTYGRIV